MVDRQVGSKYDARYRAKVKTTCGQLPTYYLNLSRYLIPSRHVPPAPFIFIMPK